MNNLTKKLAAAFILLALASTAAAALPDPGGMSANLCTESHMRELIEQGYEAELVNFRFIANTVWTTEEAVRKINE